MISYKIIYIMRNETLIKKEKDFLTLNFYGLLKIQSEKIKIAVKTQKPEYVEIPNPRDIEFRPAHPVPPTDPAN